MLVFNIGCSTGCATMRQASRAMRPTSYRADERSGSLTSCVSSTSDTLWACRSRHPPTPGMKAMQRKRFYSGHSNKACKRRGEIIEQLAGEVRSASEVQIGLRLATGPKQASAAPSRMSALWPGACPFDAAHGLLTWYTGSRWLPPVVAEGPAPLLLLHLSPAQTRLRARLFGC